MMTNESLKPEKKYIEKGDGINRENIKKLVIALIISILIVISLAFSFITLESSMDIQPKTYEEITAEISIADGRHWLADSDNRKTLKDNFFIDSNGEAATEAFKRDGIIVELSTKDTPVLLTFRYDDGYLTAHAGRRRILLSFSDDMQAFVLKFNDAIAVFEASY